MADKKVATKPEPKPAVKVDKPEPTLREKIQAALDARVKAIAKGEPVARKAAKAAVEALRTKEDYVLVDKLERDMKAAKAAKA